MTLRDERGTVLLEVLVALLILSMAGMAAVQLVAAGLNSEFDSRRREQVLATEERVLAAATLLTQSELDQRIGRHSVGELLIDVQRPERGLYRIAVVQREWPEIEDLVTVTYRPEVPRAP